MASIFPLRFEDVVFQPSGKGHPLIKNISIDIEDDGILVVVGPNGAGKSLFLRLAHGLLEPTSGAISWNGKTCDQVRNHQAMVFQRPVMLRRSAYANVAYALSAKGVSRPQRKVSAMDALDRLGLSPLAHQPARALSFGEQQKLAIARAWALRPEVMLLDEPSASLDPSATYEIEQVLREIVADGTRIILTTHNLPQARRLAERVLFVHRGRVEAYTDATSFFNAPNSELAQNFIDGELLWWKKRKPQ